jgi:hypothetical protein
MRIAGLRALLCAVQSFVPTLARRLGGRWSRGAVVGVDRRRRTLRHRGARFEQLERREVFSLTYHGGALMPHVEAQAVYLGSDWFDVATEATQTTQLDAYLKYLVQSPYMDIMTDNGFNVGQGTASQGVVLDVTLNKTSAANGGVSDTTIRGFLQSAISSKVIDQPTLNKLYVVFVEQGVVIHNGSDSSATTFRGYHGAFAGLDASNVPRDIRYAVIAYPNATAATGFNFTAASQGFVAADEFQTLTLGGTAGGSLLPTFAGITATTAITRTDETQTLVLSGSAGDTVKLAFGGVEGSDVTALGFTNTLPTAAEVQTHLNSIPALNGNVQVTLTNTTFTIKYRGSLSGMNVSQLSATASGTATATITTTIQGSLPTATQVQTSLNSIAGLSGNVAVGGDPGGPFTIQIRNLGNIAPLDVSTVTGGLVASITTDSNGVDGATDEFDWLTSVSSHELAEAVTDPDVNYKSLAWYDDPNNVENGDLLNIDTIDKFLAARTRLNGYFVQHLYDQAVNVIGPDTTATPFATALQNVTIQKLSLSRAQVSWTPIAGASGYRVFLVNGATSTLVSRVPGSQSSAIVSGLPQLQNLTFRVEAYNAIHVSDPVMVSLTLPLPALTAPLHVVASKNPASNTSAILTWDSSPGAAGYRIFKVNGTSKTLLATVGEGATTSTVNGLTAGATVSFRIEAFRGAKFADSAIASVTLNKPSLAPPVVTIQAVGGNISVVQLNWNTVSGAKGYRVYYLNSRGQRVLLSSLDASKLTTKISGLPAHTSFVVEAFSGSLSAFSKPVKL